MADPSPGGKLPSAYSPGSGNTPGNGPTGNIDATLLSYLQAHTQGVEYLVAVSSAQSNGMKSYHHPEPCTGHNTKSAESPPAPPWRLLKKSPRWIKSKKCLTQRRKAAKKTKKI